MLVNVNWGNNFYEQYEDVFDVYGLLKEIEERIGYSQSSVLIEFVDGDKVTQYVRRWHGCGEPPEEVLNPIVFGDFGWYDDWEKV